MKMKDDRIENRIRELIKNSNNDNLADRLDIGKEVACPEIYEPIPNHFICKLGKNIEDPRKCIMYSNELDEGKHIYENRCMKLPQDIVKDMYQNSLRIKINKRIKE